MKTTLYLTSDPVVTLGLAATRTEVEYIGPGRRADGTSMKHIPHRGYRGYSEVRVIATGEIRRPRTDRLIVEAVGA